MGDYNAIYEAGQSVVELLKKEMTPMPINNPEAIGLGTPQEPEDYQLTLWIYTIEEYNNSGIHAGFIVDPHNDQQERFAPLQLRCHALLSAHSKAPVSTRLTDEYRIIGRALQVIRDHPSIPAHSLVGSLAGEGAAILLSYAKLNYDELSKIWNSANKIIKPSFALHITQVPIESNRVRPVGARVTSTRMELRDKK
ncbi:DUF4255 domain-containing protein [Desulfitobacterium hafniense]|uniref:DUF4255 domain-containing protein n=1 Tax=Desulfitobacterium hafniense TaxID=49338 RepID=UPI0003740ECA|nr:DUF4255 domain-containing protein [Desulfitobacterium hafniense]